MRKTCLVVIDGWGISQTLNGNAIHAAKTPTMDTLQSQNSTKLAAHGLAVGLPDSLMGNSEVGHLNIGAGRVVFQDIVRIDLACLDEQKLANLDNMKALLSKTNEGNGRLHLLGLVSDGGVHAHIQHLFAILRVAKTLKCKNVYIHVFADGRDTKPTSTVKYLEQLQDFLKDLDYAPIKIATITGRYYAMDRDKRWERIQLAYEGMIGGKGDWSDNLIQTVEARYAAGETDEFLKPIIACKEGKIQDDDTILCFNYRSDRMRQLASVLGIAPLPFETSYPLPKNLHITTMTQYKFDFPFPVLFPAQTMENVLAETLSKNGATQIHVAETEKYAHVTFFFNGGQEKQFDREERIMVPSPKVQTYDLKPEMNAAGVAEKVAECVREGRAEFVMCNFAPPDMVGHTGKYDAAVLACAATDDGIAVISKACEEAGYTLFVTADHGNAEKMCDETGAPHTAHTCEPVPFTISSGESKQYTLEDGGALCDVAPTILDYMGIAQPKEMDGKSLLKKN